MKDEEGKQEEWEYEKEFEAAGFQDEERGPKLRNLKCLEVENLREWILCRALEGNGVLLTCGF